MVWLTDSTFKSYRSLNEGFPGGIDNRKINTLSWSPESGLFAGTLFGLYHFHSGRWEQTELPVKEPCIVKIIQVGDTLLAMSRSNLFFATGASDYQQFYEIPVPRGEDDDGRIGLFKTLWVIHSGEIWGLAGKLIVDGVGIVFIMLCITGLIYFFVPFKLKRLKDDLRRSKLKNFNKASLKWHNSIGSWAILILLLNTTTGMFLRPPLLIPIASKRVTKIKFTELDNPNPWFDRFRDLVYDKESGRFMVATGEGIYYSDDRFRSELRLFPQQPPISVMGINVFEKTSSGHYLIGSFSGIFDWEPSSGRTLDCVTMTEYTETDESSPPFGNVTVTGSIRCNDSTRILFDYAHGAMALNGKSPLPSFPAVIAEASPISLWNTCLEIHTGRIFEPVLGPFYILIVPLVGLATLFILVIGFFPWWLPRRKKHRGIFFRFRKQVLQE